MRRPAFALKDMRVPHIGHVGVHSHQQALGRESQRLFALNCSKRETGWHPTPRGGTVVGV